MTGPTGDLLYWRLLALTACAAFAVTALFVSAPWLDIAAATAFFDGTGFGRWPLAVASARQAYHAIFVALCAMSALGLLRWMIGRTTAVVPVRLWLFGAAVPALGPGLIANSLLKENWGRPRPAHLEAFGGNAQHALPFEITQGCAANCSFVSGEGSAAAAVLVVLAGLFGHTLRSPAAMGLAALVGCLWLTGAGLMRMVPGRHFLSDTLLSFALVALVGLLLYALLDVGRLRRGISFKPYLADVLSLPGALRQRLRGSSPTG